MWGCCGCPKHPPQPRSHCSINGPGHCQALAAAAVPALQMERVHWAHWEAAGGAPGWASGWALPRLGCSVSTLPNKQALECFS